MKTSGRPLITAIYQAAGCILLPVLVYFVTLGTSFTPLLEGRVNGNLTIYWPEEEGTYSPGRSVSGKLQPGENKPSLLVPSFPANRLLRLDPLEDLGVVTLRGLTVERYGVRHELTADDLAAHLVHIVDARVEQRDGGLVVTSTSNDPQLLFRDLPRPVPPKPLFLAFLFLAALGLLLLTGPKKGTDLFLPVSPQPEPGATGQNKSVPFFGAVVLVLACRAYRWPLELAIPACVLLVVTLQQAAASLATARFRRPQAAACLDFVFVAVFFLLIFLPFVGTALSLDSKYTDALKHRLAAFVTGEKGAGAARKLIKGAEDDFVRNFSFGSGLIEQNARIKLFALGISPTPKILLGKNGMFFEGYGQQRVEEDDIAHFDNVTDYMGLIPFSERELEAWRVCLEERYFWLKRQGIDYIFALAPSKAMIYPENLPERIQETQQALGRATRYEQLVAYLRQHSPVPVVDLSAPLREAKKQSEAAGTLTTNPLYYRTDFHWTYYGAYVAYLAIVEGINKNYPEYRLDPSPLTDFSIKTRHDWVHFPFVASLGLNPYDYRNETYLTFLPRPETIHASIAGFGEKGIDDYSLPEAVYANYDGHRIATRELDNIRGKIGTVFVIGDSFAEKYFGFFSAHAKKTVNFRTVYNFFTRPYKAYAPDLVVQEILNMYLLQKPPYNPLEVREARVAALAGNPGLARSE